MPLPPGNNAELLRIDGYPIDDEDHWWIDHPNAATLKAAIISPALNDSGGAGVCTRRLWIPQDMTGGSFGTDLVSTLTTTPRGPQAKALMSHYQREVVGNTSAADALMASAKEDFNKSPYTGFVFGSSPMQKYMSMVLSIDWIVWNDYSEYEAAIQRLRNAFAGNESGFNILQSFNTPGAGWYKKIQGYFNADSAKDHTHFIEMMAVLSCFNVNAAGASHAWADERLDHMGEDPLTSATALYSGIDFANTLSVISLNGGGSGFGHTYKARGMGSYEAYFAYGATSHLVAFDTATGGEFDVLDKCLWWQTRARGYMFEQNLKLGIKADPVVANMLSVVGRKTNNGLIQWILNREANESPSGFPEFRFLAGPKPTATAPSSSAVAERINHRWYYKENPATPESTTWLWIADRGVCHNRQAVTDRTLAFGINGVSLIDGQGNRGAVLGGLANGVCLAERGTNGLPVVTTPGWWGYSQHKTPYSDASKSTPYKVLTSSDTLINTQGMTETSAGVWEWEFDWTNAVSDTHYFVRNKVTSAVSQFKYTAATKTLEITDTITAHPSLYVAWHFSPSHLVSLIADGFEFTDGTDSIQVTFEPIGGMTLKAPRRVTQWEMHPANGSAYTLPLEWHIATNPAANTPADLRIAENIAYEPALQNGTYQLKTTIVAVPGGGSSAAPTPATLVSVNTTSTTTVAIEWIDNAADETSFQVHRATAINGAYTNVSGTLAANTTSYTATVTSNVDYWFKVVAVNENGTSDSNIIGPIRALSVDVTPPTIVSATIDSSGEELTLVFSETVTGATVPQLTTNISLVATSLDFVSGTIARYLLNRQVSKNEVVSLSFGANNIVDANNNGLVPVSGIAVTNDSSYEPTTSVGDPGTNKSSRPAVLIAEKPTNWVLLLAVDGQMKYADQEPVVVVSVPGASVSVQKRVSELGTYDCSITLPDTVHVGKTAIVKETAVLSGTIHSNTWAAPIINASVAGGVGDWAIKVTVIDSVTADLISGARVTLLTSDGVSTSVSDTTGTLGSVVLRANSGSYLIAVSPPFGHLPPVNTAITLVGDMMDIVVQITPISITPPAQPGACACILGVVSIHNEPIDGAELTVEPKSRITFVGGQLIVPKQTKPLSENGLFEIVLARATKYRGTVRYGKEAFQFDFETPNTSTANIGQVVI